MRLHDTRLDDSRLAPGPLTIPRPHHPGARLLTLKAASDPRGSLIAAEFEDGPLPFVPRRTFVVYDVPSLEIRGEHAHHRCEQVLVCLHGRAQAVADNGHRRREFVLDSPTTALYMPAMTWGTQYNYSADAVLLVFASLPYDPDDYIRDYDTFIDTVRRLG